jgi:hypothetical protein
MQFGRWNQSNPNRPASLRYRGWSDEQSHPTSGPSVFLRYKHGRQLSRANKMIKVLCPITIDTKFREAGRVAAQDPFGI